MCVCFSCVREREESKRENVHAHTHTHTQERDNFRQYEGHFKSFSDIPFVSSVKRHQLVDNTSISRTHYRRISISLGITPWGGRVLGLHYKRNTTQ